MGCGVARHDLRVGMGGRGGTILPEGHAWLTIAEEEGKLLPSSFVPRVAEHTASKVFSWSWDSLDLRRLPSHKEEIHGGNAPRVGFLDGGLPHRRRPQNRVSLLYKHY